MRPEVQTAFSQDTYIPIWIESFLIDRRAANVSPGTLEFYTVKLAKFQAFCNSQAITQLDQLNPQIIREYLIALEAAGHNPGGIHAHYRSVKAFLRWYESDAEPDGWKNPINKVRPPRVDIEPLMPAGLKTIRAMLSTCNGEDFTDLRDQAIILTLLDTGLRASELLSLNLIDVDPEDGGLLVRSGKGRKPRTVFIGLRTRKAIAAYLLIRIYTNLALFVTDLGERLTYEKLRYMIIRRARLAGVEPPTLHSFRRFFALEYLRAGGDIFTLQRLMGHSSLQVLRRYLNQITDDLKRGHKLYGPVDRLSRKGEK